MKEEDLDTESWIEQIEEAGEYDPDELDAVEQAEDEFAFFHSAR